MPQAETEGELLVVSVDGKGVPMLKAEAVKLTATLGTSEKRQEQLTELRRGRGGSVIGGLRPILTKQRLQKSVWETLGNVITCFPNHRRWMPYDAYLAMGVPVGTGVVESACGSVVKPRMEGEGQRWSLAGAEAMLTLRSLKKSHDHDLRASWRFRARQERVRLDARKPQYRPTPRVRRVASFNSKRSRSSVIGGAEYAHWSGGDSEPIALLEDDGTVVYLVSGFLQSLTARGCSPNTVTAYAHDLRRFYLFLRTSQLDVEHFTARHSISFLAYLNGVQRRHAGRSPATSAPVTDGLAPSTINRILAAVSTFYEYLILTEAAATEENPLDPGGDYRRPGIPRRPVRWCMRLRRIQRVPRPLSNDQVTCLMATLTRPRDRAMMLLMLQGGLRCGEVLNLHLEDVQYRRRRVVIRHDG